MGGPAADYYFIKHIREDPKPNGSHCYVIQGTAGSDVKTILSIEDEPYSSVVFWFHQDPDGKHYTIARSNNPMAYIGIQGGHLKWQFTPYKWSLTADTNRITWKIGDGNHWWSTDDTHSQVVLKDKEESGWRLLSSR